MLCNSNESLRNVKSKVMASGREAGLVDPIDMVSFRCTILGFHTGLPDKLIAERTYPATRQV